MDPRLRRTGDRHSALYAMCRLSTMRTCGGAEPHAPMQHAACGLRGSDFKLYIKLQPPATPLSNYYYITVLVYKSNPSTTHTSVAPVVYTAEGLQPRDATASATSLRSDREPREEELRLLSRCTRTTTLTASVLLLLRSRLNFEARNGFAPSALATR